MKRAIHLHGALADRFGKAPYEMDVDSVAEAVRALCVTVPGFRDVIREGEYRVVRVSGGKELELGEQHIKMGLGSAEAIHLAPVVAGAKRGAAKVILGVALVAAAVAFAPAASTFVVGSALGGGTVTVGGMGATAFTVFGSAVTYGGIASFGVAMALGGVATMLSPVPKVGDYGARERPDQRASFLFNGAVNTSEQGQPIPLVFGRMRVGSVVISSGIKTEKV